MLTGDCRSRRSQFLPSRPCSAVGSASRSSWRSACPAGSARSLDFLRRSRRKTRRELRLKCLVLRGQEARRVSLQTGNSDIYLVHRLLEAGLCFRSQSTASGQDRYSTTATGQHVIRCGSRPRGGVCACWPVAECNQSMKPVHWSNRIPHRIGIPFRKYWGRWCLT